MEVLLKILKSKLLNNKFLFIRLKFTEMNPNYDPKIIYVPNILNNLNYVIIVIFFSSAATLY